VTDHEARLKRISNQTDVFVVGSDAATHVSWVEGGGTWNGPLQI
jgi:hypothetical protein